jgi:hypothetical protein
MERMIVKMPSKLLLISFLCINYVSLAQFTGRIKYENDVKSRSAEIPDSTLIAHFGTWREVLFFKDFCKTIYHGKTKSYSN